MMTRSSFTATLAALLLVAAATAPAGADWPGWRGLNRDGKSTDTGLRTSWPAGGPTLLFKATGIGSGYSSMILVNGTVYITGVKGKTLYLHALDAKTGKKRWSIPAGPGFTRSHGGSRATPVFDNGLIYLETGMGQVGCYRAADGKTQWTRKFVEFGGRVPTWGFAESVLIVGEMAIVTPGGTACMVALDKATGKTIWTSQAFGQAQYVSPIYIQLQTAEMIVTGTKSGLIAVHAKTGKTLWTNDFCRGNTANCPTPAYANGYLFWANGYGKGGICLKLTRTGSGVAATEVYRTRDMVCHHGGYVIDNGFVYGDNGNGITCLELETGKVRWKAPAMGKGSLCWADGMLYVFGERGGRVGLGTASPNGFKLSGQFSVSGRGPSWAHPVVTNGLLGVRYDDTLYVYDVKR